MTDSYAIQAGDPLTTSVGNEYQYKLYAFTNNTCTTRDTSTPTKDATSGAISVGQAFAFGTDAARDLCTSEPCANTRTYFKPGDTVFLSFLGFDPSQANIQAVYTKPNLTTTCAISSVAVGAARPDSDTNGVIAGSSSDELNYPPANFNAGSQCGAINGLASNEGQWTLGLLASPFGVTVPAFIVDSTNPSTTITRSPSSPNGTPPWYVTSPVGVTLSASDPTSNGVSSGVNKTYYSLDDASCTPSSTGSCSVYTVGFSAAGDGITPYARSAVTSPATSRARTPCSSASTR